MQMMTTDSTFRCHGLHNRMSRQRIAHIDIAKGIAIWLMIVGHMEISELTRLYIYSFHMPLFFMMSGMFFNKERCFVENLKTSTRTLLIPYFFFSFINLSICWISPYLHPELYYKMHGKDVLIAAIKGMFIGSDHITPTSFMPLGALWFLISLFTIQVVSSALSKMIKNDVLFVFFATCFSVCLFFVIKTNALFSIRSTMMAFPFYVWGYFLRNYNIQNIPYKKVSSITLILYFIFIIPLNGFCTIDECIYGKSIILFYLNAVIGTVTVLSLCSSITQMCNCNIIETVGRKTLVILGLHAFPLIIMKVLGVVLFGNSVLSSPIFILIVSLVVMVSSYKFGILFLNMHWSKLIRRYFANIS